MDALRCVTPTLLLLAVYGAYIIALFLLWFGRFFCRGRTRRSGAPVHGLENLYFQAARFLYFGAPVLVAWVVGVAAARQRVKAVWLSAGLVVIALLAASSQVHAGRTEVPRGLGHISMGIAFGTSVASVRGELLYAFVILTLGVLPYLLWRLQRARSIA